MALRRSRLLDFGTHGKQAIRSSGPAGRHKRKVREYFTGAHEPWGEDSPFEFSPEQSREATNYLKAVDRNASGDDWKGTSPFLQGPSSYDETYKYKDPIQEFDYPKFLMESDSETLDDLATDDASELQRKVDLYEKNRHMYDRNPGIQNEGNINVGTWDSEARDELAIDIASQDKARADKILQGKEASMADFKGEEEGEESWWKGLFSSDDSGRDESLAQEKKDNEELSGKIGAAAKLYSLLKPETPQAAPTIPTARVTRGSVAFPGMKLASQKERRKYFTPKGLMA